MAKRIVWSSQAQKDRKEILLFWLIETGSKRYSKKLDLLFRQGTSLISMFPEIGKETEIRGIRAKVIRDYLMYYKAIRDKVYIVAIWDPRQDEAKIIRRLSEAEQGSSLGGP